MTKSAKDSTIEATVTSRGQVTLPSELLKRFGITKGSRIRFIIPANGPVQVEPVRYRIDDLWSMSDARGQAGKFMPFEEMDEAKAGRKW